MKFLHRYFILWLAIVMISSWGNPVHAGLLDEMDGIYEKILKPSGEAEGVEAVSGDTSKAEPRTENEYQGTQNSGEYKGSAPGESPAREPTEIQPTQPSIEKKSDHIPFEAPRPRVTGYSPDQGTKGVSRNPQIVVWFNTSMNIETVKALASLYQTFPNKPDPIPIEVSVDPNYPLRKFIIKTTAPLYANALHLLKISGGDNGVQSQAGKTMTKDFWLGFKTGALTWIGWEKSYPVKEVLCGGKTWEECFAGHGGGITPLICPKDYAVSGLEYWTLMGGSRKSELSKVDAMRLICRSLDPTIAEETKTVLAGTIKPQFSNGFSEVQAPWLGVIVGGAATALHPPSRVKKCPLNEIVTGIGGEYVTIVTGFGGDNYGRVTTPDIICSPFDPEGSPAVSNDMEGMFIDFGFLTQAGGPDGSVMVGVNVFAGADIDAIASIVAADVVKRSE